MPVHSLMMSSHLCFCLPCLLPPFTVPCKMVLARPEEWETCPYHFSLHLFMRVRRSSCGPVACWTLAHSLCTRCIVSCSSTSFPWLIFFFAALLCGSMIHKPTGRWMYGCDTGALLLCCGTERNAPVNLLSSKIQLMQFLVTSLCLYSSI